MYFEIWHDNDFDLAHWLYLNSDLKNSEVIFRQIPKTNNPSDLMKHLIADDDVYILPAIKYETPDLILVKKTEGKAPEIKLVIELMTHTPQHDHPLQRFTRLYGSAWLGIPSILVIPAKKEKLEKGQRSEYSPTIYRANPLIYHLFIKTTLITKTATLLLHWPEKNGYLKYDKTHPTAPKIEGEIIRIIDIVNSILANEDIDQHKFEIIESLATLSSYNAAGNDYDLTSGQVISTSNFIAQYQGVLNERAIEALSAHDETFVYSPMGLKSGKSAFRTDPYAGKTCAFEILFCRDHNGARSRNLVLIANKVPLLDGNKKTLNKFSHSIDDCPFINPGKLQEAEIHFETYCPYTERKQQRIFGEIPDIVIFEDGGIYVS